MNHTCATLRLIALTTLLFNTAWASSYDTKIIPNEQSVMALNNHLMQKALSHKALVDQQKHSANEKAKGHTSKAKEMSDIGLNKYREQQKKHMVASTSNLAGMMVFVSLTMPDQVLKTLIKQADQLNIPVMIRGFYADDFQKTITRIADLLGVDLKNKNTQAKPTGGIAISSEHFKHFNITEVPAFVLIEPNRLTQGTHNITAEEFDVLTGNLSLIDAIDIFKQKASSHLQPVIQSIADKQYG